MNRKYDKVSSRVDIAIFSAMSTSKEKTLKEVCEFFQITGRQFYHLCKKNFIDHNLKIDRSYMQSEEFREKISRSNFGKLRSEEHRQNYVTAAAKREFGNNRKIGEYKHSEETKAKIKASNTENWTNGKKPSKWLVSTLENEEWFLKLRNAHLGKEKSEESIRKMIETKTGMSFEEWQNAKTKYEIYWREVTKFTKRNSVDLIENYQLKGVGWHLDHVYSISDGWRNNVPPRIVGHHVNLRFIPATENLRKNKRSDITKKELIERYHASIE